MKVAGTQGGTACFEATTEGLRVSGTITGSHLNDRAAVIKETMRTPIGRLPIRGASVHNVCYRSRPLAESIANAARLPASPCGSLRGTAPHATVSRPSYRGPRPRLFVDSMRPVRPRATACVSLRVKRVAEGEGFEPPEPCGSTVFKTVAEFRKSRIGRML